MRKSGVAGSCVDAGFGGGLTVFDELERVTRRLEKGDFHIGAFDARDTGDQRRIARRPGDQLEAEAFPQKAEGAIEARDREAGVVRAQNAKRHSVCLIELQSGSTALA